MVAAHSCCEPTLCSRSCNCGELAMVSAARKAMTMLMPIPARAFMPAGDLVDARNCASFSNLTGNIILTPNRSPSGGIGMAISGERRLPACCIRPPRRMSSFREPNVSSRSVRYRLPRSAGWQPAIPRADRRLRSRHWNNCDRRRLDSAVLLHYESANE